MGTVQISPIAVLAPAAFVAGGPGGVREARVEHHHEITVVAPTGFEPVFQSRPRFAIQLGTSERM